MQSESAKKQRQERTSTFTDKSKGVGNIKLYLTEVPRALDEATPIPVTGAEVTQSTSLEHFESGSGYFLSNTQADLQMQVLGALCTEFR